ncbi:hypothetical protein B808_407 [Fructilactobacillus florum 8D]|uniref:Uncharacterized protein n=1 Tax=Fructilactobacillus florum 8D TaxID=1221538 RepID=W9ELV7_9LACO|nr:hypothetical protein B807_370 [Fructilactobacillus florum 2F]ETO40669.1 hypothetical protein B808_407 [Fructilactobacillus florum 8D]
MLNSKKMNNNKPWKTLFSNQIPVLNGHNRYKNLVSLINI